MSPRTPAEHPVRPGGTGSRPVRVRPETRHERDAVLEVTREAFGEEGDLIATLIGALHTAGRVLHSLVAVRDGQIVGHTQLNLSWLDAPDRLVTVAVLAPLSVRPIAQRAGVGAALIDAALTTADAAGLPAVLLEGDPSYYSRHGFVVASRHGIRAPSPRIPEPACQIVTLSGWQDGMAGPLVYCDAFWELDCVGLRGDRLQHVLDRLADPAVHT